MVATVSVILLLVSIGSVVGPIGGVVIMYQDNLTGLVVPPQITNVINNVTNGNNNPFGGNGGDNDNQNGGDSGIAGIINPVVVGTQVDPATRTFSVTIALTNNFQYDLTLNSLSASVQNYQDNQLLASISVSNPVTIVVGQTSQITVSGLWTQEAENLVTGGASSVDISLANLSIDVNGISVQLNEPYHVGNVPLVLV